MTEMEPDRKAGVAEKQDDQTPPQQSEKKGIWNSLLAMFGLGSTAEAGRRAAQEGVKVGKEVVKDKIEEAKAKKPAEEQK